MSKDDMWDEQPAPSDQAKSSLDDKLVEIVKSIIPDIDDKTTAAILSRVVPQIKRLFTYEGYVKPVIQDGSTTIGILTANQVLCSGQEWYDRFVEELKTNPDLDYSIFDPIYEVAMRAAGLE